MRFQSVKKVLILGSGGLQIGQAGEFDYSGSQAIKAFREDGVEVILLNPNIATVQTDSDLASKVYFLPLTLDFCTKVIQKERPDGILLGFGGQTALNVGLLLEAKGILKKYGVKVLGTPINSIRDTEDRGRFAERLKEIGVKVPRGKAVGTIREAMDFSRIIGYPLMMRSGFSLGGAHSGVIRNRKELLEKLKEAFIYIPQVLLEEYVGGWKEVEYEVVRDCADNAIAVCNMENFDPMGVHTGESIVVAPSQTLNNFEYHKLREIGIKVVRYLGIVGECNIQFALNPKSFDYRVIEVNARLSRSSALASKATGYPLAFVAAKLSLGYTLPELENSITKVTRAYFEPSLDYLVLKMPRWDFNKFKTASRNIGSEMRSVGEVMALGRKFEEVLQKAIRMADIGANGLVGQLNGNLVAASYWDEIKNPTDRRIFAIVRALQEGASVKKIHRLSGIDSWFLERVKNVVELERKLKKRRLTPELMQEAKQFGFSDKQIGAIKSLTEEVVRKQRQDFGIRPVIKQIDTLAGEFPARTNYLYLTYNGSEDDVSGKSRGVIVLGSGSYSIGSSVEFDWCGVQAVKTLKKVGEGTIMINYNPETVSTDYDIADRLYFEELSLERILDIYEFEKAKGVVVSTGGQIPNRLALKLHQHRVNIFGTHPSNIDLAEDRYKFSRLLDSLRISQPAWREVTAIRRAKEFASEIGYPVLIRPSYVLSGTAMNVVFDEVSLERYLGEAVKISDGRPVVISKFIEDAKELEVDGVAVSGDLIVGVVSEHVEQAGVHSGDATVVVPPVTTSKETQNMLMSFSHSIVKSLKVTGPFNIQFLEKDGELKVIECNLRSSRSFPFISKAVGQNLIDVAIRSMFGKKISIPVGAFKKMKYFVVKSPQFSYRRIKGADPLTYVEMTSTGEVASFGRKFSEALLKSMLSANFRLPRKNIFLSIGKEKNKLKLLGVLQELKNFKFHIFATENTADFLRQHHIPCKKVYKIHTGKKPSVADLLDRGNLDLIVNIPSEFLKREAEDGFMIRRKAVDLNIPLISNAELTRAFINALVDCGPEDFEIKHRGEY